MFTISIKSKIVLYKKHLTRLWYISINLKLLVRCVCIILVPFYVKYYVIFVYWLIKCWVKRCLYVEKMFSEVFGVTLVLQHFETSYLLADHAVSKKRMHRRFMFVGFKLFPAEYCKVLMIRSSSSMEDVAVYKQGDVILVLTVMPFLRKRETVVRFGQAVMIDNKHENQSFDVCRNIYIYERNLIKIIIKHANLNDFYTFMQIKKNRNNIINLSSSFCHKYNSNSNYMF